MEQRISLITLGVRDIARARRFYEEGLGWKPSPPSNEDVAFYQVGGFIFAIWGEAALAEDSGLALAAERPAFRGVTLAHNVPNPQLVDALLAEAERAGGRIVKPAEEKFWGGYSGCFADPDGHVWEVAWNPHFPLQADGTIRLPSRD